MATSNDLTTLDFASVKENLKQYLKDQPVFNDFDFEASNINVLLDVLAYNTNLNAFYLNMIANEMFLDSALLRDSIISHAKELNYVPRSFRSASVTVDITLTDTSPDASIIIPRGTSFTGTLDNKNFTFTTAENIKAASIGDNKFLASEAVLYEGDYVQDSYVTSNDPRYLITNKTVDTTSIRVTVIEDNGENVLTYFVRDSLFDIGASSQVFFIQAAENDSYEIVFGDGVIGRPPKNNSIVVIEYRVGNGELPNGIRKFSADDDIGTATVDDIKLSIIDGVQTPASGGAVPESLESIKFNAPRAFTTQERVVTAQDYATLLKANFSEINDVVAFGGEQSTPPQFGRVLISVDLKTTDDLPPILQQKFLDYIKPRSPLSITPVFVTPEYTYLTINTKIKYDNTQTALGIDDIKALVEGAIQTFNFNQLDGFNKALRYSKLLTAIDNASDAIVSNDTEILVTKYQPLDTLNRQNYTLDFNMPLVNNLGQKIASPSQDQLSVVRTNSFNSGAERVLIEDDGAGNLNIVTDTNPRTVITKVGSVNYESGLVEFDDLQIKTRDNFLKVDVRPREKDVDAQQRTILRVLDDDINIEVEVINV